MSNVTVKSILVKKSLFCPGFCLARVFAFSSFSLLFLPSINFPNLHKVLIKASTDSKELPFGGLEHSSKIPNREWCSLEVSHSAFRQHSESTFSP